jgi:hypothetical protein
LVTSQSVKQCFNNRAKRLGINTTAEHGQGESTTKEQELYRLLKGKRFWYSFDKEKHEQEFRRTAGNCCYMHITGLFGDKAGNPCPIYPFQEMILDSLDNHKYIFWKKSVGIGATSLLLAWASWLCTRDDLMKGKEIAIVVGPNLFLAQGLIARVKQPFLDHGIILQGNATSAVLNGCTFTAYPSNHLDSMRSRVNLKGILCDEADFFQPQERAILRDVIERYISKSDPWIILCSTVAKAHGFFYQIEKEPQSTCLYHRLVTDYRYGLGTMYDPEAVERMRTSSPSFAREMECFYSGMEGDVFSAKSIELAVKAGNELVDTENIDTSLPKFVGLDPGFGGSSNTAITVTQLSRNSDAIEAIYSKEMTRPTLGKIVSEILYIHRHFGTVAKIYVDDSAPVVIRELKLEFGERHDWKVEMEELRHDRGWTDQQISQYCDYIKIFPLNFRQHHKDLLWNTKRFLDEGVLRIPEKFERLVISLRTATAIDGSLDKAATEFSDSLDSLRLSLFGYELTSCNDYYS